MGDEPDERGNEEITADIDYVQQWIKELGNSFREVSANLLIVERVLPTVSDARRRAILFGMRDWLERIATNSNSTLEVLNEHIAQTTVDVSKRPAADDPTEEST